MGSVDLGCHGCCQKIGPVLRNYCLWNTVPLENFAIMSDNQLLMVMNWLEFFFLFAFYFIFYISFYRTYFHSLISLLRNNFLLLTKPKLDRNLCLVFCWRPPESDPSYHSSPIFYPQLHKSPLGWLLCVHTFTAPIQTASLFGAQQEKVMLNAWWQVPTFPEAKYLKCHHSHHRAYFLCHLDSFGCQDEFPNSIDTSFTMSWG